MKGRVVVKPFLDQFLETFHHLWRQIRIKLDDDVAVIRRFDNCHLSVRERRNSLLHIAPGSGRWAVVEISYSRLWVVTAREHKSGQRNHHKTYRQAQAPAVVGY